MAKIEQHSLSSDVTKKVNICQTIRWIVEAWKQVTSETIKKCFRKAGVLDQGFRIRSLILSPNAKDPFADYDDDADEDYELAGLISQVQRDSSCSIENLIMDEEKPQFV